MQRWSERLTGQLANWRAITIQASGALGVVGVALCRLALKDTLPSSQGVQGGQGEWVRVRGAGAGGAGF